LQCIEFFKNIKNLNACFTTRIKGFSKSPYNQLNFASYVGDNQNNVEKNFTILKNHLKTKNLVLMKQIHSGIVKEIKSVNDTFLECDAIITNQPNIYLRVMVADCNPILVYDKHNRAIGAINAGRAGVFKNIINNTLLLMKDRFKTNFKDLEIVIGPSIKSCCYEVGQEIADICYAKNYQFALSKKNNSYYLDLIQIILFQLKELNILDKQIVIDNHCTSCDNNLFYSYRKEKTTGRFLGVIGMKDY